MRSIGCFASVCVLLVLAGCLDTPIKRITQDSSITQHDGGFDAGPDADVPQPCETDEQCTDKRASRCGPDHLCIPCGDNIDCGKFPDAHACIPDVGCFECDTGETSACTGDTKVCDLTSHACVQCSADNDVACTGDTDLCDLQTGTCVQCLSNAECTGPGSSVCNNNACESCSDDTGCAHMADNKTHCNTGMQTCVECFEDAHCPLDNPVCDVAAGTCNPCQHSTQCGLRDGTKVCFEGGCVECAKDERTACDIEGKSYVCDATTHACDAGRQVHSKTLCNACVDPTDEECKARRDCVSNDECQEGQACVEDPAGAGLRVCLQIKTPGDVCPRPYNDVTDQDVSSIDGDAAKVCTFGTATTCQAHADYRKTRCGTPTVGNDQQDEPNSGDDTKCGAPGLADGYCVFFEAQNQFRCTVPCNNDPLDCPVGAADCNAAMTPNLCVL